MIADSAGDGELVRAPGDVRSALPKRAIDAAPAHARRDLEHGIELWKSRNAGRDDKRSAILALARYLEPERAAIKQHLLTKDEGALFGILNNFDIRHRDLKQQIDYDEVFLDWLFWWYLATAELIGHLNSRDAGASSS